MRLSYQSISLAMIIGLVVAFIWQHQHMEQRFEAQQAAHASTSIADTQAQRPLAAAEAHKPGQAEAEMASLRQTVSQLQAEVQVLQQRLATMTDARSKKRPRFATAEANANPTPEGSGERIHALREDVDALLTGAGVESAEGKDLVAAMVEQQRQEDRSERHAKWQRIREEADETWIQDFSNQAELDDDQLTGLREVITKHRDAKREVRGAMRRGESDFRTLQKESERLHAQMEATVTELLTETQFNLFQESQAQRREAMRKIWH